MENLLILYITCFIIFYFSGRAVFLVVEKATKKKTDYLFNLKKENFYILLGIICITEFLFVSNFDFHFLSECLWGWRARVYCTRGLVAVCTGSAILCLSSSSSSQHRRR